ncbi:MAG: hypothetical protein NXI10_03885 [bacterium]|nr:hypothetical protein [bacterium]
MSTDSTPGSSPTTASSVSKFTKKKWLIWASAIATVLVVTYTLLHWSLYDCKGEKTHRLSTTEFAAITSIVQSSSVIPSASTSKSDTLPESEMLVEPVAVNHDSLAKQRVKEYLNDIMVLKNKEAVYNMIDDQGVKNVTYLSNYPFKVQSYFWLTDYWVLLEVIFWSLFGLIANLMYSVTRTKDEDIDGDGQADKPEVFDPNRVSEHIGKFWYTPLTAVVIYMSIDYLTASGEIQETPEGAYVVVFAFILGFFSRRTIALLRKLKDIFFPNDTNSSDSSNSEQNEGLEANTTEETAVTTETDAGETVEADSTTDATINNDTSTSVDPATAPGTDPAPTSTTPAATNVSIEGTVTADASTGLKSLAGTVINLYGADDPKTVLQTVTLPKGTDGSFSFEKPVAIGSYTYDASKTLSKSSYSAHGTLTVIGQTASQQLKVTLTEAAG